jgi:hypothetical protein
MRKTYAFHIEKKGKKHYYLRGESDEEVNDWITYLQKRAGIESTPTYFPEKHPTNRIEKKKRLLLFPKRIRSVSRILSL